MQSKHILVADDNLDVLFVVSEVLRSAGYRVSEAGTRERAETILDQGSVDLLIADSVLSDANGKSTVHGSDLSVILMSGDLDRIVQSENSPFPFLAKPFHSADLLSFVSQVIGKPAKG